MSINSHGMPSHVGQTMDDALCRQLGERLTPTFKGQLIGPDHSEYNAARTVWNAMVDKRPGLIARCASVADVQAAVNAARAHGLAVSVRGGGHSVSGKALTDGGLTIDLSGMRTVKVDADRSLVHADGGCLLADVDEATAGFGLVVPAGTVSETGLAGLALGGGVGWLTRKYGLTCDNFESLEVVLADGQVVEASPTQHPGLYWGLRGGGGNFGVVTRFTLRAHKFGPSMRVGVTLHHASHAKKALHQYAELAPTLPRTVGWHAALKHATPAYSFVPPELAGEPLMMLLAMWLGDADDPAGINAIGALNQIGSPCLQVMTVMPFAHGVQKILDAEFADGHRYYTKEVHLATLPHPAADKIVDFWRTMPMHGQIEIIGLGGAISDVGEADAAFANRQHPFWVNFALHWDAAADDNRHIRQIREAAGDLAPWIGPGAYVNALNFDETERVVEAFGGAEKYLKLGRVKAAYDPHNLFHINHNVLPNFTKLDDPFLRKQ